MPRRLKVYADGWATWQGRRLRCAVGRGGIHVTKREGDGVSPAGCYPLLRILYRPDRVAAPVAAMKSALPIQALTPQDGWCDDPADPLYNQQVRLPYAGRHEKLWREDGVYDVIVVLGHNHNPPVPHLGSAIFLHIAKPEFTPTEGCAALTEADLLAILAEARPGDLLCFAQDDGAQDGFAQDDR